VGLSPTHEVVHLPETSPGACTGGMTSQGYACVYLPPHNDLA
jgi:hypothetical protein